MAAVFLLEVYSCPIFYILSFLFVITIAISQQTLNGGIDTACIQPAFNIDAMPRNLCAALRRVCIDQGSIVSYDPDHYASFDQSLNRSELRNPLPYLPSWTSSWNIPGAVNSDAIVGNQDAYTLTIRPATRLESSPSLQRPSFSSCTLPVVLLADWPFNFGEFFANGASAADLIFRTKGMLPDNDATLVLALPLGLASVPFHQGLLGHHTKRPIITIDRLAADVAASEATARGAQHYRVAWSYEGFPVACFERVVVCKLQGSWDTAPIQLATTVVAHLEAQGPPLPRDPLSFATGTPGHGQGPGHGEEGGGAALPPLDGDTMLRVAIEARQGGSRTIRNLHHIIQACNAANWTAGPFRRLSCRALITHDTPELNGLDRFRNTVAAVQSAHVLVAVHGAGAVNGYFLRPGAGTASALLEVRPCGFGSGFTWWVDVHMAAQLPRFGDKIRFHAYNIEDPAQCSPAEWDIAREAAGGAANTRAGNGHRMRDQHLTLRPDGFLAMLRHVASMLRDPGAYDAAKAAGKLHGYGLPGDQVQGGQEGEGGGEAPWGRGGGVVLGPLGVSNLTGHVAEGAEFLLRPG